MRIGVNFQIVSKFGAGPQRYARTLLNHLIKIDSKNQYYLYARSKEGVCINSHENLRSIETKFPTSLPPIRVLWEQTCLPCRLMIDKVDILFSPAFILPIACSKKTVVTILDLIYHLFPKTYSKAKCLYYEAFVSRAAHQANRIITISENNKRDIIEHLRVPEEKVTVTYCGVDSAFAPVEDATRITIVKKKYHLPDKFILSVGTLEPRKNIPRLLRAFANLLNQTRIEEKLVITGMKGWLYGEIFDTISELGIEEDVHFTGFASDSDLPALYSGASLFVFPSIYEGFGFPPLEAMACGTPVITSNTSSLPEVIGNAGIMVNPYKTEEIAEAMYKLLSDENIQNEMRRKGIERAKQFSWEETAKQTLYVYEEVFSRRI